ncbi:hypothetical protein ANCDUO_03932 [Ancylostoma duodenale]|uniref:Reverse transcriptase domain-containing protein n=1 Tax=Ancylostoma duodenale TaxID=51022 RepID=A0A0C2D7U8_9BILA|nr:hypothetical protein ANCDUO_03932 [Ancylostoma duodenale]
MQSIRFRRASCGLEKSSRTRNRPVVHRCPGELLLELHVPTIFSSDDGTNQKRSPSRRFNQYELLLRRPRINVLEVQLGWSGELTFADKIVVLIHTPQEAESIIQKLNKEGKKAGLHLNIAKTKVMRNRFADPFSIRLDQAILENEYCCSIEYVCLGQLINMDNNLIAEIIRRKTAALVVYNTIEPTGSQMKKSRLKTRATTVILALQ